MTDSIIYMPKKNPDAKLLLFCIPYAGGSISSFFNWQSFLPDIELGLIAYPGRYHRYKEEPILDIDEMLEAISSECKDVITKDFAIFGHSMGSIVGYGLAQKLEQENLIPKCLFVSAAYAPVRYVNRGVVLSSLNDDEFIRILVERYKAIPEKILNDTELMKIFIPLLRADISLEEQFIQRYDVQNNYKLSCPIVAFGGVDDTEISHDSLSTWESLTSSQFYKKIFPGSHFYLHEHPDLLFKEIINYIHILKN